MTPQDPFTKSEDELPQLDIASLRRLAAKAPETTLHRLRTRNRLIRGTRLLVEKQIMGFWIVLNEILKHLFRSVRIPQEADNTERSSRGELGDKA